MDAPRSGELFVMVLRLETPWVEKVLSKSGFSYKPYDKKERLIEYIIRYLMFV